MRCVLYVPFESTLLRTRVPDSLQVIFHRCLFCFTYLPILLQVVKCGGPGRIAVAQLGNQLFGGKRDTSSEAAVILLPERNDGGGQSFDTSKYRSCHCLLLLLHGLSCD